MFILTLTVFNTSHNIKSPTFKTIRNNIIFDVPHLDLSMIYISCPNILEDTSTRLAFAQPMLHALHSATIIHAIYTTRLMREQDSN